MAGIKETMDFISALHTLGEDIKEAKADGTINWLDAPKFASSIAAARAALQDSEKIKEELADLDPEETAQVMAAAVDAISTLAEAVLGK